MIHRFADLRDDNQADLYNGLRSEAEQSSPLYQVHDTCTPDVATARRIAREVINVAGALIKVHARTDNADVRAVHDEDPDPTYWPAKVLKGFFVPQPMEYELTPWGVDSENKAEIVFALTDIVEQFGERLLRTGDLLEAPFNSMGVAKPKFFCVDNAQEFGNFRYNWLYLKCQTTLVTPDSNIMPPGEGAWRIE